MRNEPNFLTNEIIGVTKELLNLTNGPSLGSPDEEGEEENDDEHDAQDPQKVTCPRRNRFTLSRLRQLRGFRLCLVHELILACGKAPGVEIGV